MGIEVKKLTGSKKQDGFGYSIASGDINGDGKNEIITVATNSGRFGLISVYSANSYKIIKTIEIGEKKINTVRVLAKDINQDNIDELIVAITYEDLSGEVKVISLVNDQVIYHFKSVEEFDAFGFAIAVGDVNRDGIPDLVISAPMPIKEGKGKVYVYSGKDGALIKQFISKVPRDYSDFGTSIAVGDINGDGIDEVIIGAPGVPNGEVLIYSVEYGWLIHQLTGDPGFGIMVHVDDIDNDEVNELIVTTKDLSGNTVSVFKGARLMHLYDIENDEVDIGFGEVITTGDINGDGNKELIISAFNSPHRRNKYSGQVAVYNSTNGELLHRWYGFEKNDQFGFSLATNHLSKQDKANVMIGSLREMGNKPGVVYIAKLNP